MGAWDFRPAKVFVPSNSSSILEPPRKGWLRSLWGSFSTRVPLTPPSARKTTPLTAGEFPIRYIIGNFVLWVENARNTFVMRVFAIVGVRVDLSERRELRRLFIRFARFMQWDASRQRSFWGEILRAALRGGTFLQSNTRLCFKHAPVSHRNGPRSVAKLVHVVNDLCALGFVRRSVVPSFMGSFKALPIGCFVPLIVTSHFKPFLRGGCRRDRGKTTSPPLRRSTPPQMAHRAIPVLGHGQV